MLRKEFEQKEKEKQRKAAVLGLFKDENERQSYGFTDKTLRFMRKAIRKYRRELQIEDERLKRDDDYVKVDDTWLDLSLLMFHKFRNTFTNERLEQYYASNPEEYLVRTLI